MKHLSEYRDPKLASQLIERIEAASKTPAKFMEVCGTHTVAISKSGIRETMPKTITLLSGPGCPVCVTANGDLDKAISLAREPNVILATFGDMMKVPGSFSSLSQEKAQGKDIRVVYSTLDALKIAGNNPQKTVVFLGVGFETTTPTIAFSILEAKKRNLLNYKVLSVHKLIPPAMKALLDLGEIDLKGFICPGHVSVIIGSTPYEFIVSSYGLPCVISGFEPIDVLQTIYMLAKQVEDGRAEVEIQYRRGVRPEGNKEAQRMVNEVFETADAQWRGIGKIPKSGLKIKEAYKDFDALNFFSVETSPSREPAGCSCGEILRGVKFPYECKLFGKACLPESPIGPCMVSSEGACASYFKYGLHQKPRS